MAERSLVFENTSIGVETLVAPGSAVPATHILGSLGATVTPNPEIKTFTPKGSKFATAAVLVRESTGIKLDGMGTYNEMIWPLAGILADPVITTPAGATLARKFFYPMASLSPDAMRSFSLEFGSALRSFHCVQAQMTEFGLTFSRKDMVKASGAMIAQAGLDDKIRWLTITGTPTGGTITITIGGQTTAAIPYNAASSAIQTAIAALSNVGAGNVLVTGGPLGTAPVRIRFTGTFESAAVPAVSTTDTLSGGTSPASSLSRLSPGGSQLPLVPISPTTVDLYTASTYAGLAGAPKLLRNFTASWKLSGRVNPFSTLNSSNGAGFAGLVEGTPKGEWTMDVAADDVGMGFLGNLRRGDTVFARITATGPQIEVGSGSQIINHSLQIDVAVKLTKISEFKDIDSSLLGVTYSGEWTHDPTWGYATQATIVTNVATL